QEPKLADLVRLDDAAFRELFRGSPIKRIGRDRFIRNVLIAIGNSRDLSLMPEAQRLLDDPSALVRGAAIWAISQLDASRLKILVSPAHSESDPDVLAEWQAINAPEAA
ncbi:MAG TPA: hypothetical protein VK759_05710, partial [Rhizomicrobium sp.]|nr:hypothetical protein [Rhizomicrobium sp.]